MPPLLIPFAAPLSEAGGAALAALAALDPAALPNLAALIARAGAPHVDAGDEWSFSPPHERALARAWGWQGGDGALPFAARAARADGVDVGDLAWGLVTPAHWHLGTDQVSLLPPGQLLLAEADARALFEAAQPLFTSEGFALVWGAATRWYVAHESLAALRTASLDRVVGRNVDRWLAADPAARRIRRLQAEVQMLWHTHAVNATREAQGLRPVNSFWLSGCGVAQPERTPAPQVDDRLREPALAADWAGWAKAWETLDAGPLAACRAAAGRGEAVTLMLCGERSAATLTTARAGWWATLRARFAGADPRPLLEAL